jgi:tetratricopeptide (TPR) repeat protein
MIEQVASVLQLRIDEASLVGTTNERAYSLYLQAIGVEQVVGCGNNQQAINLLEQAISLAPTFARAHAALAEAYVTRFYWLSGGASWLDQAEASAQNAVRLAPTLAESHVALAYTYEGQGRRKEAILEYLASLRVNKHYASAIKSIARYLFYMARYDASIKMWDLYSVVDPPSAYPAIRKAQCHFFKGELDNARNLIAIGAQRANGSDELTLAAFTLVWLGDYDLARQIISRLSREECAQQQAAEIRTWLATAQGPVDLARSQIEIVEKHADTYGLQDEVATWYAVIGDKDRALQWLAKAISGGAPNYAWYRSDFFKSLRGDPRYEAVLKPLADEYASLAVHMPS